MKTSSRLLALAVSFVCLTEIASAQQFGFDLGPIDVTIGGGIPQGVTFGTPAPTIRQPQFLNPNDPWNVPFDPNPTIHTTPKSTTAFYDPQTGRWTVRRKTHKIKASALDPNRHVVDPGSRRAKSSIRVGPDGTTYETMTVSWTSYGVPHSETTTRAIRRGGQLTNIDEMKTISHSSRTVSSPVNRQEQSTTQAVPVFPRQ